LRPWIITLALLMLLPGTALAGNDWLKEGSNLLGSFLPAQQQPSSQEISNAFKEALDSGTRNVVQKLGRVNGFNNDRAIHIPLPRELNKVRNALRSIGQSALLDDLELKLNRAAEATTPKAKALFVQAIRQMTFADVKRIYNGPDDAATRYFEQKMGPGLAREMRPIVDKALARVGAVRAYDRVMGRYRSLPFVPDVKAQLDDHVVKRGIHGIFYYLAKEEADIRHNPGRWTSRLLKRVFGSR
jgi:hypothetical protein